MRTRYQHLIGYWYAQTKGRRYLILLLMLAFILCCEAGLLLYQPICVRFEQYIEYQDQDSKLSQLTAQLSEAKKAQRLLDGYKNLVPNRLITPTTVSGFQTYAMSFLQQQAADIGIAPLDIQLRDRVLFLHMQATPEDGASFIKRLVTHPWFVLITQTKLRTLPNHLVQIHLQLTLVFQQQQKVGLSDYESGIAHKGIQLNRSNIDLSFLSYQEQGLVLETASQGIEPDDELLLWQYDALIKTRDTQMVHLIHAQDGVDIWLQQGERLGDSIWRLETIDTKHLSFIHKESNKMVSIYYSGGML